MLGAPAVAAARLFFLVVVALFAAAEGRAQPAPSAALQQLLQRAEANEPVRIIIGVRLESPFQIEGELRDSDRALAQRERIAAAQEQLSTAIAAVGARVHARFAFVPHLAAEVDSPALRWLMNSPLVTTIDEDRLNDPLLAESGPLIGAPGAWGSGLTGAGWHVAVLDTGVDKTHPFLGGKVVSEACYSSSSSTTQSLCPGGATSSTASGSGVNCTTPADTCGHGTHVAGIAAGLNASGGFSGVAKDASLIAIQVFSYRITNGSLAAYDSDIIKGLERVYALRSTYNIAAVNMSLGGGAYSSTCDTANAAMKSAIDNLRSAGIAVVIASGNNGYKNQLSYPACISSAVSVGASCDAGPDGSRCQTGIDGIASYSNINANVTIVAPGSYITSSLPGNSYAAWSGTSMAAPHVAGAWALMKQQTPSLSVTDGIALARSNADTINDTRSGGTAAGLKLLDLGFLSGQSNVLLFVTRAGNGNGTVTSTPAGINCGSTCVAGFDESVEVTLTAVAAAGSSFTGWGGDCSGSNSCTVSMNQARNVTATFATDNYTLAVSKQGVGTGTVTSTPVGINCGATCSASFSGGTMVTLTAAAGPVSSFAGWSGACTGIGTCVVTMNQARSVTATFNATTYNLALSRTGTGSGTVASTPSGINCGGTCSASFVSGTVVNLAAVATAGSVFAGWGSPCSGTGNCSVLMSQARSVTARFNTITYGLTVSRTGTGSGAVTSNPSGINCGSNCTVNYDSGSSVTLTATASPGSIFVGWSGGCSGVGICTVSMTQARSVTATFNILYYPLTVTRSGAGSGTVTSLPAGINCGSTCNAAFPALVEVTLSAAATQGSVFLSWGGACSGSGSCTVAMNAATAVSATFVPAPDTVPNAFSFPPQTGVGVGTVVTSASVTPSAFDTATTISVSSGQYSIGCGVSFTDKAGTIVPGQSVCIRHTAALSAGTTVTTTLSIGGVSGGFSSTTSTDPVYPLAVTTVGSGTGTVSSSPAGIDCGGDCDASYTSGTSITLAAAAAVKSTFTGFSDDCSGTDACSIGMNAPRIVKAAFEYTPATAAKASSLYIAFFVRAGDQAGLNFWKTEAWKSRLSDLELMRQMARGFAAHPLFVAAYGGLGNAAFVDAIYINVGGKPADARGKAYWLGLLNAGMERSNFIAEFVFGLLEITEAQLQDLVDRGELTLAELQDALARKARMAHRSEVALAFVDALGTATNLLPATDPLEPASLSADPAFRASQNILRQVTEDLATMTAPLDYLAGTPTIEGINTLFGP